MHRWSCLAKRSATPSCGHAVKLLVYRRCNSAGVGKLLKRWTFASPMASVWKLGRMRYTDTELSRSLIQGPSPAAPQLANTGTLEGAAAPRCEAGSLNVGAQCLLSANSTSSWRQASGQSDANDYPQSTVSPTLLSFGTVFKLTALDIDLRVRRLSWATGRVAGDADFNMLGTEAAALAFAQEDLQAEDWVVV